MNLDGESLAGIEELDEQWKAGRGIAPVFFAEDFCAVPGPELVKCLALEWSVMDDTLGLRTIHHFPQLPDRRPVRDRFSQKGCKSASSPDAFHGKGFKEQGGGFHGQGEVNPRGDRG